MTQYLIRTLTDSTGHPFTHVTKARENETFTVVEADSKEEAKEKVTGGKSRLFDVKEIVLMSILSIWLFAGFIIFIFKFLL
ncbi:DUF1381 domain-containing protein [Staphylococcus saprophyticus]|uniref:DUF1381 domain-containing protein n=1 Tax=Staphylococcus saprophyticus TaxID=29385 RepID=UPI000853C2B3|nr:DUF1381 domain-containing protein [Staphylococcus saprophyticus]MDW3991842.1 DUF1381 domain-containing protein [Staphylococcus saprophyticus]MDW4083667.1 DUF1381 domain-containing protein [Staphylococcus saprophyticus]OEK29909.1 hypothetical protein ASS86_09095 [Staphylococcus saprophyticus]